MAPKIMLVEFHAAPGKEGELRAELLLLVDPTRKEEGCIQYDLHTSTTDPLYFAFYEIWRDEACHAAHDNTPHVARIRSALPGLIASPVRKVLMTKIEPSQ